MKAKKSTCTPLLIISKAATGESIPPDNKWIVLPDTPTGNPPNPLIFSQKIYEKFLWISIFTSISGSFTFTIKCLLFFKTKFPKWMFKSKEDNEKSFHFLLLLILKFLCGAKSIFWINFSISSKLEFNWKTGEYEEIPNA